MQHFFQKTLDNHRKTCYYKRVDHRNMCFHMRQMQGKGKKEEKEKDGLKSVTTANNEIHFETV